MVFRVSLQPGDLGVDHFMVRKMIIYEVVKQDGKYYGRASVGNRHVMICLYSSAAFDRMHTFNKLFLLGRWQQSAESYLL